ncbi:L-threonine dehydratase catabolic TdcB-like [Mercenaria mercenaria]|uniref:L-threonine dehydratase catabolic TdcB-like n=1 Tax=Mercenaria mercenaria TaxID=6596 RepID=UPI00234EEBD6|nr:L-threonine dehydratase catabolic TdcB-like [Mercenaria mercenaria]
MSTQEVEEEIVDIFCDPDHPKSVAFEKVINAQKAIGDAVVKTPCRRSQLSDMYGMEIYTKKEFVQYTGSFKERGARNSLLKLSPAQKKKGVIAASAGNHALALSYHGKCLGIPVYVVMPTIAPMMKIKACAKFGANITISGDNINDSKNIALKKSKEGGQMYINGYDHPDIIAGQGTIGLEIVEQVPDLDACIIPVGGGGMIAGIALAIKTNFPKVKIIGVEPENSPGFQAAMKAGKPIYTPTTPTLADGLAVPTVGVNAFETAHKLIDKIVTVNEENMALAILRCIELEKAVVEGGGAAGLAAIIQGLVPELKGKKVVVILSGGNIDTTVLGHVIERALATDERLVRFRVSVRDRPGGMAELTKLLADQKVSIVDIFHERPWEKHDVFAAMVKVVCETRDAKHSKELHDALEEKYPNNLKWGPSYD